MSGRPTSSASTWFDRSDRDSASACPSSANRRLCVLGGNIRIKTLASAMNGLSPTAPGVNAATGQCWLPSIAPSARRGSRPAFMRDDLPHPEAPITARKRCAGSRSRDRRASTSLPRPKNIAASSTVNARRPGYGEPSQAGVVTSAGELRVCSRRAARRTFKSRSSRSLKSVGVS